MTGTNFDPSDPNPVPASRPERTESENKAGGRSWDPDGGAVSLYKNVINNLLEDTYYQDASEQFTDVVDDFLGVAGSDDEFALQLATHARHEGGYRDIAQLLLVLSANFGRNEINADIGNETVRYQWNRTVVDDVDASDGVIDGDLIADYTPAIIDRTDEFNTIVALQRSLFGTPLPRPLRRGIENALHECYALVEVTDGDRTSTERVTYVDTSGFPDDVPSSAIARALDRADTDPDVGSFEVVDSGYTHDTYTVSKYMQRNHETSLHDVLNLVHPKPRSEERSELFGRIAHGDLDDYDDEPLREDRTWESTRSSETTIVSFDVNVNDVEPGTTESFEQGVIELKVERDDTFRGDVRFSALNTTNWDPESAFIGIEVEMDGTTKKYDRSSVETNVSSDFTPTVVIEADLSEADEWRHRLDDMGLMARIRNLRNMLQAGLSGSEILDYDATDVAGASSRTDEALARHESSSPFGPESERRVQEHQQFPMRFYQAYKAVHDVGGFSRRRDGFVISNRTGDGWTKSWLESAMDASIEHLPEQFESTFTAIDLSGSMNRTVSSDSELARAEIATLFGAIVTKYGGDVGAFGDDFETVDVDDEARERLGSIELAREIYDMDDEVGNSTNGWKALKWAVENDVEYDRWVFFTDEQIWDSTSRRSRRSLKEFWDAYVETVNPDAHLYVIDLAAYGDLSMPQDYHNVHQISGWSDNVIEYIDESEQLSDVVAEIAEIEPEDY